MNIDIQALLAPGADKFAVLGLPRRYDIDAAELKDRYRAMSRELHPDRFATAPPHERVMSLQAATTVNDAYRTLKHPVRRAEYLLTLAGKGIAADAKADPELLMEVMELREALGEAKAQGDKKRAGELELDVRAKHDRAMTMVRRGFADEDDAKLDDVRDAVMALRYYERFLAEAERMTKEETT